MDSYPNQKVYVNPNFNRLGAHLNKNFPHQVFNTTQNTQRKIFINPNFVTLSKKDNTHQHVNPMVQQNFSNPQSFVQHNEQRILWSRDWYENRKRLEVDKASEIPLNENRQFVNKSLCLENVDKYKYIDNSQLTVPTPLVKSRYCLVNSLPNHQQLAVIRTQQDLPQKSANVIINTNPHKVQSGKSRYKFIKYNVVDSPKINKSINKNCTVKISKYKMVTVSSLKTTLQSTRNTIIKSIPPLNINLVSHKSRPTTTLPMSPNVLKTKFKLTMYTPKYNRTLSLESKRFTKTSSLNKIRMKYKTQKILKRNFKINNIPCPLYSKYGKCLRKVNGNCEYLHDKKHVSLCRKFLKGICHDTNCLLSHELSDKKMPTCYFYLKGMCTKEQCPYMHIKLNEKTKLCQDFLKGYCEKGENCLMRHVKKQHCLKNMSFSLNKSFKQTPKPIKKSKTNKLQENNYLPKKIKTDQTSESDHRYYKDVVSENNEKCEIIKPMRCKLGTLPSFIQI